jgi:hypothetical protein
MKTYKRELAVVLLLWLAYVVEVKDPSLVEVLVWPIFTYVMAAFGFDQYAKLQQSTPRTTDRGRSQRSSQRPSGQDQLPDARDYENLGPEDK